MAVKVGRLALLRTVINSLRGSRVAGAPSLVARVGALPRLVSATLTGRYRGMSTGRLAALALGVVYVLSPVDLVPELVLPLIGLGDDLVVVTFVLSGLLVETEQFLVWEREEEARRAAGAGTPGGRRDGGGQVVEGEVVDGGPPGR